MRWLLLLALALGACALPVDTVLPADSVGGGCVANPNLPSSKILQGNYIFGGNVRVLGDFNQGSQQQGVNTSQSAGQIGGSSTPFFGDLYVRGTAYQSIGSQWIGPITNPFGASYIFGVAYGNGVYVAVSAGGKISRSTDNGATWSALIGNPFGVNAVEGVCFANGVFIAVGTAGISRSTDNGVTWSALVASPFGASQVNYSVYGNGVIVAGTNDGKIARSTDLGLTWGSLITNPLGGQAVYCVAYGNGVFVITGSTGGIIRSTDLGLTWGSLITNPFGATQVFNVAFGNTVFVAVGAGGKIARSIDSGITWGSLLATPFGAINVDSVAYLFGIFQVGSDNGQARSVDNGITWSSLIVTAFTGKTVLAIAASPTNLVAIGGDGVTATIATAGWNPCYSLVDPVAGEPSCGSFHPHWANLLTGGPAAVWTSIDLSAQVPVGAKAVQLVGTDFTGTNSWYLRFSNANAGTIYLRGIVPGAGLYGAFGGPVPITSSRLLWYICQTALGTAVTLDMSGYYT